MARTPALFNGPIEFMDLATGKQISIPLTAIYFDQNAVKAEGEVYTANKAAADPWLAYLVTAKLLTPDLNPPPKPAMVITAKDAGGFGNSIQFTSKNLVVDPDPTKTKLDVVVTEVDTYTGLTPATVQLVLGKTAGGGSQPGLVFVPGGAVTDMPAATTDLALTGDPASVDAPKNGGGGGKAFTVQAKAGGADGALTRITIADVNVAASTFTLIVNWSKTGTAIKPADIPTTFAYEIVVAPPDGGVLLPPANGIVTLSGGSDAQARPAAKAAAVVLAG